MSKSIYTANCIPVPGKTNRFVASGVTPFEGDLIYSNGSVEKRYMFLYKVICLPTQEIYYGQHICGKNCSNPINDHYNGSGHELKRRREVYDWNKDFIFIILKFVENSTILDIEERKLISENYEERSLNIIKQDSGYIKRVTKNTFNKGRSITNILPFVSPLNGLFFPRFSSWRSTKELSLAIGFNDYRHISSLVMNSLVHDKGEWWTSLFDYSKVRVTKFVYVDQLVKLSSEDTSLLEDENVTSIIRCNESYKARCKFVSNEAIVCLLPIILKNRKRCKVGKIFENTTDLAYALKIDESIITNSISEDTTVELYDMEGKRNYLAKFTLLKNLSIKQYTERGILDAAKQYIKNYNFDPELILKLRRESCKGAAKMERSIIVLEDFTSPLNGKTFPKGYIFYNANDAAELLGFSCRSRIYAVMEQKDEPGVWRNRRGDVVARFARCKNI